MKCISMTSITITKTASRNVAFKAARMSKRIMESQDEFTMRKLEEEEIEIAESENDKHQAALDDIDIVLPVVGFNADIHYYY